MKRKVGRPKKVKRGTYKTNSFTQYCREHCYDKKKVIDKLCRQWLSERKGK